MISLFLTTRGLNLKSLLISYAFWDRNDISPRFTPISLKVFGIPISFFKFTTAFTARFAAAYCVIPFMFSPSNPAILANSVILVGALNSIT